jgi:hypothetical protein
MALRDFHAGDLSIYEGNIRNGPDTRLRPVLSVLAMSGPISALVGRNFICRGKVLGGVGPCRCGVLAETEGPQFTLRGGAFRNFARLMAGAIEAACSDRSE